MAPAPPDRSLAAPWLVFCDGTALPNPGPLGVGALLVSPTGERHEVSELTELRGGGNEAEAWALVRALREAERLGARTLRVTSDSRVVVDHMSGTRRVVVPRLRAVLEQAEALRARFDAVQVCWAPRHNNTEADTLARAAFGRGSKPSRR
jgi:ribonuclease HI